MKTKQLITKLAAVGFAAAFCITGIILAHAAAGGGEVLADEQVRSVYTN